VAAQEEQFGPPVGQPGQWASCLRIVEPGTLSTQCVVEVDGNEAITSMCLVKFEGAHERGWLLAVGTAEGMTFFPTDCQAGYIRIYRWVRRAGCG
jgi:splicing factor 3B subunit 3